MKFLYLLACLPCLFSTGSFAEETANNERWFQVEMLIFKNPALKTTYPEAWPDYADINEPESFIRIDGATETITSNSNTEPYTYKNIPLKQTIELEAPVSLEGLEAFKALLPEERQLLNERRSLDQDRRYQVLFHEAWNQPVPGRDLVVPIRVDGGERFGRQAELQGYINLYVERYLHLSTDLHLIEYASSPDPFSLVMEGLNTNESMETINEFGGLSLLDADSPTNNQITQTENEYFVSVMDAQLKENRRMRSKEIHYLDNPEFGMLVLITPINIKP